MADLIPPRRNEFLTKDGLPTTRFAEYLESLAGRTNENTANTPTTLIETALALIFALENRLGSGDFLTWDEEGFSWDNDDFTFDMDEA